MVLINPLNVIFRVSGGRGAVNEPGKLLLAAHCFQLALLTQAFSNRDKINRTTPIVQLKHHPKQSLVTLNIKRVRLNLALYTKVQHAHRILQDATKYRPFSFFAVWRDSFPSPNRPPPRRFSHPHHDRSFPLFCVGLDRRLFCNYLDF